MSLRFQDIFLEAVKWLAGLKAWDVGYVLVRNVDAVELRDVIWPLDHVFGGHGT